MAKKKLDETQVRRVRPLIQRRQDLMDRRKALVREDEVLQSAIRSIEEAMAAMASSFVRAEGQVVLRGDGPDLWVEYEERPEEEEPEPEDDA